MSAPVLDIDTRVVFADYALEVAEAVLGGTPLAADHPGRRDALAAMNALGYSTTYMAEQLGVQPRSVYNLARKFDLTLDRDRHAIDQVAIDLVLQGDSLALRGADLQAAVTELAKRGKTATQCARLLKTDSAVIARIAAGLGVQLAKHDPQGCWWVGYVDKRKRTD